MQFELKKNSRMRVLVWSHNLRFTFCDVKSIYSGLSSKACYKINIQQIENGVHCRILQQTIRVKGFGVFLLV